MKTYLLLAVLVTLAGNIFAEDKGIEPEVFQREYIFTNGSIHKEIQVYGLRASVALYLYDEAGNAIVAHLDHTIKINKEIPNLLNKLSDNISAKVYGGEGHSSVNTFGQIIDTLSYYGVSIIEQKQNKNRSISLSFNLITNEVGQYSETKSMTKFSTAEAKIKRLQIGMKRLYRHEDSLGGGDLAIVQELAQEMFIPKLPF